MQWYKNHAAARDKLAETNWRANGLCRLPLLLWREREREIQLQSSQPSVKEWVSVYQEVIYFVVAQQQKPSRSIRAKIMGQLY